MTESLRESLAARRLDDPRIDAMVMDVRRIRTEVSGLNRICNFATGNAESAVKELQPMQSRIDLLEIAVSELRSDIRELRTLMQPLLDRFAEWEKTKGKKA